MAKYQVVKRIIIPTVVITTATAVIIYVMSKMYEAKRRKVLEKGGEFYWPLPYPYVPDDFTNDSTTRPSRSLVVPCLLCRAQTCEG